MTNSNKPTIKDISLVYDVLTDEEKNIVEQNYTEYHYNKGDLIYRIGDTPKGLLCLGEGKLKIFKPGLGGKEQIVRLVRTTEFIGYRSFFAEEPHVASAVAIEPAIVFFIPKDIVYKLLKSNYNFSLNIIKSLAAELEFSRDRTISLTQKHIRGRLAESLLVLVDTYGFEDDGVTINIRMTREDLSDLSNMTSSNVTRTLKNFAEENVVDIHGREIKIVNLSNLKHISRLG